VRKLTIFAAFSLLISSAAVAGQPQKMPKPLSASQVLALVAGAALPEDIAREISQDGLAFRPDANYREMLKTAGADPKVLVALDAAKLSADAVPESPSDREFLIHLANASALMNQGKYEDAAREMLTATVPHLPCPECGFVMGRVFTQIEDWYHAEAVYRKVLDEAPGFPEAHARLALAIVHLHPENAQDAQVEARAAILQNPDDPEAHKVAGQVLADMQNYPAAIGEYREALRLKPDYAFVHYDLALIYETQRKYDDAIGEYQIAVRNQPDFVDALYNLGNDLVQKNDIDNAVVAFRQAEKYDPKRYDVRQNLGSALMNHGHAVEAVVEFRELVKLYPDEEMAVYSLGLGLEQINQLDEAAAIFAKVAA
jgi:tetratricopeptide (TPR) repeat protein